MIVVVVAAAKHHIVELLRWLQAGDVRNLYTRAGAARLPVDTHHLPGDGDLSATAALITRQTQHVDKARECR